MELTATDLSKVTWVSDNAFNGCNNLRAVALPKEKPEIHEDVFTVPLLLLVNDGGIYADLYEFPEGSSYPSILGASAILPGDALVLTISPDGGDGISYQWYLNQSLLPGKTERTLIISNAQKSNAGKYECEVRIGTVSQRISKTVIVGSSTSSGSGGGGSSSLSSSTGSWMRDTVGWWYQYNNGTYPKSEWKQINNQWYYFEESGYMKTGWLSQDGKWYWLDSESGKMVSNDWVLYQDNRYYFGGDGAMVTGWQEYNNEFYYLSEVNDSYYGHLLRNTTTPDGYSVNQDGVRIS